MLPYLSKLAEAGVCSFKIEGRMKSRYYLANTVNAYRRALGGAPLPAMEEELEKCAHARSPPRMPSGRTRETVNYENAQRAGTRAYAATFWRAAARLSCRCAAGSASATSWRSCLRPASFNGRFTVGEMTDEAGAPSRTRNS